MRRSIIFLILVGFILWDYSENGSLIFVTMDRYVEQMLEFFHLA